MVQHHAINVDTNEIYLHSSPVSDNDNGIDYRCTVQFIKNFNILDSLSGDQPIIIHLNSPGGDISQGLSIYDVIKQSKKYISIIGYADVASMSSVILQAADRRLLMANAAVLIHNAALTLEDMPSHGVKSASRYLEYQDRVFLDIYATKCLNGKFFKDRGYNLNKVKCYLKRKIEQRLDWTLNAEEAKFYGFCDYIIGDKEFPTIISVKN